MLSIYYLLSFCTNLGLLWNDISLFLSLVTMIYFVQRLLYFFSSKYTRLLTYLGKHLVILAGYLSNLITNLGIICLLFKLKLRKVSTVKKYAILVVHYLHNFYCIITLTSREVELQYMLYFQKTRQNPKRRKKSTKFIILFIVVS